MVYLWRSLVPIILASFLAIALTAGCGGRRSDTEMGAKPLKPQAPPPFKIEGMPDSEFALGKEFKEQTPDPVEVLKGWKVQYSAILGSVDDLKAVKWEADGKEFGEGSPFSRTEGTVGTFTITMKGTKGGEQVAFERKLVVGEVQSEGFELAPGGNYEKPNKDYPHWVAPPTMLSPAQDDAIKYNGKISLATGSPSLSKFKWGFIQGVELQTTVRFSYDPNRIFFDPASAGTEVKHPEFFYEMNIPPNTNDAPRGVQIYGGPPKLLGEDYGGKLVDNPGVLKYVIPRSFTDNFGILVKIHYSIQPNTYYGKFTVWQVVFNNDTKQYVPLKQQGWRIEWDSNQPGPFKVGLLKEGLVSSPTTPETSSDDYIEKAGPTIISKRK